MALSKKRMEGASKVGKNGSRKGIPNKTTKAIREALVSVINGEIEKERLVEALDYIFAKDKEKYLYAVLAISKQVLPALAHITIDDDTKEDKIESIRVIKSPIEEAEVIEDKKK